MSTTINLPVSNFAAMANPYYDTDMPKKWRFFVHVKDVPASLLDWMRTNPREQNLSSDVAKAIAASLRENSKEFFLRNRGILVSAEAIYFSPSPLDSRSGELRLELADPAIHGNIDGGHTLRIILAAQEELGNQMPEEYVEFEVITGLKSAVTVAEARNASVALDVRSLEEMKGSYAVLKETFQDWTLDGNRWFDRVEVKMNQQKDTDTSIDIRNLISMLLMFNQGLYPVSSELDGKDSFPIQMYGGKEVALKKYLSLGGGTSEGRDEALRKMAPIMRDIVTLWDHIERDMAEDNKKAFSRYTFSTRRKQQKALFSQSALACTIPQALVYPILSSFRVLVHVDEQGMYSWRNEPMAIWESAKKSMYNYILNDLKSFKGNVNSIVKNISTWRGIQLVATMESARATLKETEGKG